MDSVLNVTLWALTTALAELPVFTECVTLVLQLSASSLNIRQGILTPGQLQSELLPRL